MIRARTLAVPALVLTALSFGPAWGETAPPPAKTAPAATVSVVEAERREIVESVVVTGTLVPRDEILVTPEIDGYRRDRKSVV